MMQTNEICKTKLTRQSHYCADNLAGVQITKSEALDEIYHCLDTWINAEDIVTYWGNEFLFRDAGSDEGRGVFYLVEDYSVLSVGISELRKNTHVVLKETSFGVMWKILPLMGQKFMPADVKTCYIGKYDGCFTRNFDGIVDKMNIVNQPELFGTFLDPTIENQSYILWTALRGIIPH